jgi:dihydrofolate reductase
MMRVLLIAAISLDGFIARSSHELVDWSSKEDKKLFVELTREAGVLVMGGITYRTIGRPLPHRRNIVYSHQLIDQEGVETTQEQPAALIARLEVEGYTALAVCGGQSVYDMFLRAGVVTDMYITVEPLIFGTGISLCNDELNLHASLKEQRKLNDNTLMMHYEVIR